MTRIIHNNSKWWLHKNCAGDAQAIIGGGFKHLRFASALLFSIDNADPAWLSVLESIAPPTPSEETRNNQSRAAVYGFTALGLRGCGLDKALIERFGIQFNQGMTEPNRIRQLGDVKDAKLDWSGSRDSDVTVHFLLLLYTKASDDLTVWSNEVLKRMRDLGVEEKKTIQLTPMPEDGPVREHFGFVDGISQPLPVDVAEDLGSHQAIDHKMDPTDLERTRDFHEVNSGDFLFGRLNSYKELAPSPFIAEKYAAGLKKGRAPNGFRDFGYNGTFLVVRQLEQDVQGFWQEYEKLASHVGLDAKQLAERVVGRTLDGELLTPTATTKSNNLGFSEHDNFGDGCPLGSHVRRANPRDGGAKSGKSRKQHLKASNNHRILRRGRNYGPQVQPGQEKDSAPCGLFFMCVNTDIRRQFEFIQETWLNSNRFARLNETDPLLGAPGTFTMQNPNLRKKITLNTYVTLKGGDYFFLPSLSAVRYLMHTLEKSKQ